MQFVNLELARRVEFAEATACSECAEAFQTCTRNFPSPSSESAEASRVFAGPESPVTQAIGVGINGQVEDADFDRLGEFFHSRNAPAAAEICPFVEMSLVRKIRHARLSLARSLERPDQKSLEAAARPSAVSPDITLRPANPTKRNSGPAP